MSNQSNEGTICTAEELARAAASGFYCLTRQQTSGLVVVAMSGFISLFAVLFIVVLVLRNVICARKSPIQEPMDLFMLSLFTGALFQALGVVLEVKWIDDGIVRTGGFCTAQGIMQNLGQAAVAMTTTIITLHTFSTIWYSQGVRSLVFASILVGVLWLFLILFITISSSIHNAPSTPFYSPTPYWCWINSHYPDYRIAGENFWLWLAFAVSVLYIPLVLWSRGYISPASDGWWRFQIHSRVAAGHERTRRPISDVALIFCALAYCIPVLPTSLARWFLSAHDDPKPFANAKAQFTVKAIFTLSGICDVIVFRLQRQGLLLFPVPEALRVSLGSPGQTPPALTPPGSLAERGRDCIAAAKPPTPRIRPVLLSIWLIINALDVVWIYFYIRSATNPNPRSGANKSHAGWQGYYVMLYIFGFSLGVVNVGVWLTYLPATFEWFSSRKRSQGQAAEYPQPADSIGSKAFGIFGYSLHILIILPIAIIMSLSPFFTPLAGVKIARKQAWHHRCDSFPVEAILQGCSYDSPKQCVPLASFYFGQPLHRTIQYEYGLTQDENDTSSIWHLRFSRAEPNATIPSERDITYRFDNKTVVASCAGVASNADPNAITPCMEGSFRDDQYLSFTVNDTRTNTVTNLTAVDKEWAPIPADDAPSYILKEAQSGAIALRTAVTRSGHCNLLKLCLEMDRGVDLVAVGLTLFRQDEYSKICTTPNSN